MGSDNHEHDSHYHGEPSRILDDTPLPELVVVYEHGFPPAGPDRSSGEDRRFWVKFWRTVPEVTTVVVSQRDESLSKEDLTLRERADSTTNPFHPDFDEFDSLVRSQPSVLFVPARLRISPGTVEDLTSNDVSVNWLALEPDRSPEPLPGAVVLSDWITQVSPTLPAARSSGVAPGIFHLRSESLKLLEEIGPNSSGFSQIFQELIDHPEMKLRPALFHNREWSLGKGG